MVFVLMPIVCFVYLRRFGHAQRWRPLWWPTLLLGTITAVADIVFSIVTKTPDLIARTAAWAGLLQRLVIIPFMVWVVVFASRLFGQRPD